MLLAPKVDIPSVSYGSRLVKVTREEITGREADKTQTPISRVTPVILPTDRRMRGRRGRQGGRKESVDGGGKREATESSLKP